MGQVRAGDKNVHWVMQVYFSYYFFSLQSVFNGHRDLQEKEEKKNWTRT